ncbi:MAG: MoaD/ThiS family protein [Planctomycetota bacterium]|jgi:molybdopterin converting factor small subunit
MITVRMYAGVKEKAGVASMEVAGTTIAALRDALAEACPPIAAQLGACRFALDNEFVDETTAVPDGATVDVIPPVSGG